MTFSRELLPRFWASTRLTFGYSPADTDLGPVDLGSYSSRVTLMAGNAALQAAERGKAILAGSRGGKKLQVPKERLCFARKTGVRFRRTGKRASPSRKLFAWPKLVSARLARWAPTLRRRLPRYTKAAVVGPSPTYSYSAAVVQVESKFSDRLGHR